MSKKNNRRALARIDDWYGLQPLSRRRWKQILVVLGDKCLKCGAQPVTRDHVVPLASGGLNHPANLQPLCHRCNVRKGDTTVDYRMPEQRQVILERWPIERIPIENYTRTGPMRAALIKLTR
jgi:5-methylcytosine-specific restriction endonuclease McrA